MFNCYKEEVKREIKERENKRELEQQAHREKVKQCAQAYNNMNYYSTSEDQKKMFETIWKSLL